MGAGAGAAQVRERGCGVVGGSLGIYFVGGDSLGCYFLSAFFLEIKFLKIYFYCDSFYFGPHILIYFPT